MIRVHDVRFACQDLAVSLLGASLGARIWE